MTDNIQVADALYNRGTLMDLFIGKPTFQKKLRPNDMLLEGIDEDVLYLGHKKLLPPKAMEQLVKLEGQARTTLAGRSLSFPLSGARFVFYPALPDVLIQLKAIKAQWDTEVEQLIVEYPQLKETQLVELDKQAKSLFDTALSKASGDAREALEVQLSDWLQNQRNNNQKLYPPVEDVREMFTFKWSIFKINGLDGGEEMSTLDPADLKSAQNQIKSDLQKWVQQASIEMHQALGAAAANAARLLQKNDKLDPRNLRPLFEAFETFKAIDFTGSSDFLKVIDSIKQQFGRKKPDGSYDMELTSQNLKDSPSGMTQFKDLIESLGKLATSDVAEKAGIQAINSSTFRRMIEI